MAAENICVFCGEKVGKLRSTTVQCGNTWQTACKSCEKELQGAEELELCQRALLCGLATDPERIRARIQLITEAEDHRPKCISCGGRMIYRKVQNLDNSPYRDTVFQQPFEVLPACCDSCGRYDLYDPAIMRKNKHLAYLSRKDTQES